MDTPDASFDHSTSHDSSPLSPRLEHHLRDYYVPPSPSLSPSLNLQDERDLGLEPASTLSAASSPARSTSSYADSLAGQPPDEVERVALELISNAPPSHEHQLQQVGGGLDPFVDLPRPPIANLSRDESKELEKKAVEFLKRKLQDADQDDWMYPSPPVFGPPKPLGLRNAPGGTGGGQAIGGAVRGREFEEGLGWDDKDGNGPHWSDRAFNYERYQVEGLRNELDDLDLGIASPLFASNPTNPEDPEAVEDWSGQGGGGFEDSVGHDGFSFTG